MNLGYRVHIGAYGELSELKYPLPVAVGDEQVNRLDHGWTVGATFGLVLFRNAGMTVNASRTHYSSNIPGADRNVTVISSTIAIDAFLPYPVRDTIQ